MCARENLPGEEAGGENGRGKGTRAPSDSPREGQYVLLAAVCRARQGEAGSGQLGCVCEKPGHCPGSTGEPLKMC